MKKKFYLLGMLAAGLTFVGCTDDIDDASGSGGNATVGDGYVKVAINLPTTSGNSTRAGSANDNFDDGLSAEYKVNNVILALFYGADESLATCKWAKALTNETSWNLEGTNTDNITTKSEMVISEVPKPGEDENVYAFVIVNNSGYFGVDKSSNKLKYGADGSNLSEFSGLLSGLFTTASSVDLTKIASSSDGNFMMTNAPISDKASVTNGTSWNPTISTLVKVNVYDDKPTAEDATPTPIYVERVAAKVQVTVEGDDNTLDVSGDTYNGATVTFDNWTLQNTNKKTYLVRNVGTGDGAAWKTWIGHFSEVTEATDKENRFVGTQPGPYRTYWGIDPNYEKIESGNLDDNFNIISQEPSTDGSDGSYGWLVPTGSLSQSIPVAYCAENTTEAQAMAHNQLTGVLLKATFKPSGAVEGSNFFTCNDISTIYTETEMIAAFTAVLASKDDLKLNEGESIRIKEGAQAATITDATDLKGVFEVEVKTLSSSKDLTDDQVSAILNKYKTIKFYKGGVTYYYTSLIKHFGDYYTPVAGGIEALDSYSEKNHLGRYGVVRNNWYELNITSVSGPGEPEIPEIPEEPGDKKHSYINAEINVLSWAKRQQNVDL